jgi:hypothetical protein
VENSIGIGDLAAILTAAGVTIYALGLIGLAIPISRKFTEDLTTAWYAVSLLPRTVVAGQGVRFWIQWPLFLTAFLLLIAWLLPGWLLTGAPIATIVLLTIALSAFSFAAALHSKAPEAPEAPEATMRRNLRSPEETTRSWARSLVISVPLMTVGIAVVATVFLSGKAMPLTYEVPVLFAGSFLMGVPRAITTNPPLPKVEITKKAGATMEANSSPPDVAGHLITHSDGFWYLFDGNNELLSIPDDQVLEVRTLGRQPHPPAEQLRKLDEDMKSDAKKTE